MKILSIAGITFKEGLRHRVLFGVIVAALFVIFLSILLSGLFMRDVLKILLDVCLSSVSISGLLVPFFLTVAYLSGDMERRTIYTILAKPISRSDYLLGKFLGLSFLTAVIMAILTGATILSAYGASWIYPKHLIPAIPLFSILSTAFLAFLGVLVLNSCAFLWCMVTTSSFLATLLILSTYLIGQTLEEIVRFIASKVKGVTISPVIDIVTQVAMYIFPNLGAFDFKSFAAHGLPIPMMEAFILCVYAVAYISIMLLMAIFFFRNRDLT